MKESVMEEVKRIFRPEFINIIDEIIVSMYYQRKILEKLLT